jgi:hypothetical protein
LFIIGPLLLEVFFERGDDALEAFVFLGGLMEDSFCLTQKPVFLLDNLLGVCHFLLPLLDFDVLGVDVVLDVDEFGLQLLLNLTVLVQIHVGLHHFRGVLLGLLPQGVELDAQFLQFCPQLLDDRVLVPH